MMAVKIRLMRMGSKRRPFYRFVVADSRGKRDGGFLDMVGHYNPIVHPEEIAVDEDKVFDWLRKGAEVSDGARSLLKKIGLLSKWNSMKSQPKVAAAEAVEKPGPDEPGKGVGEEASRPAVGRAEKEVAEETEETRQKEKDTP